MVKQSKFARLLAAGMTLSIAAAASTSATAADLKVGFIGPLTGSFADLGSRPKDTLNLVVNDINAGGGLVLADGSKAKIKMEFVDDQGSVETGATEMRRLIEGSKVDIVIGGMLSSVALAEMDVAENLKTPFIVAGAIAYAIGTKIESKSYKYVFQATPTSKQRAEADLNAIADLVKPKRIYAISQDTDWGREMSEAAKVKFSGGGYEVIEEFVRPGTTDYSAIDLKIQQMKPDLIYASLNGSELLSFMEQKNDAGIQAVVFGSGSTATADVFVKKLGKDVAAGTLANLVWLPQMGGEAADTFAKKYRAVVKSEPSDLEAQTYDTFLFVLAGLAGAKQMTNDGIAQALLSAKIDGIRGPGQQFDPKRHGVPGLKFAIGQLQGSGYKVVWPKEYAETPYKAP